MPEEFIEEKTPEEIEATRKKVRNERKFELEELKTEEELSEEKKKQIKKSKMMDWILLGIVALFLGVLAFYLFYF